MLVSGDMYGLAERAIEREASTCCGSMIWSDLRVIIDTNAPHAIAEAADQYAADVVLIGRRAKRFDASFIRLGSVARRILRVLPTTILTVPPDVRSEDLGDGPILLATDLTPSSEGAARFSRRLARHTGRPLRVLHAASDSSSPPDEVEDALRRWCEDHDLDDATLCVREGEPADIVFAEANACRPLCVAVGSRRLSMVERVFETSVGSTLSARARWPVSVSPA